MCLKYYIQTSNEFSQDMSHTGNGIHSLSIDTNYSRKNSLSQKYPSNSVDHL